MCVSLQEKKEDKKVNQLRIKISFLNEETARDREKERESKRKWKMCVLETQRS